MENMKIDEVVSAVQGKLLNELVDSNLTISSVATDSRKENPSGLFVAIVGENNDGHDYIGMAKQNGAVAALVSKVPENFEPEMIYILVEDTIKALKALALAYRLKFHIPIVAVIGSVGKTTTKDMIASVLSVKYNTLKTMGNLNSEIGAPLTVLSLNHLHEAAVIEMGMDHLGQIHDISKIVKPQIAVITNIGVAHIEYLKTRENILKAKCEVFENMQESGVAILNKDDDMLVTVNNSLTKKWYSINTPSDVKANNITVDYTNGVVKCEVVIGNNTYNVKIPGLSKHLVYSALSAILVGLELDLGITDILKGIESFVPTKMRMEPHALKNNILVIDDTYNANPDSMKSLIDTISNSGVENKVVILGDMFELGSKSLESHSLVIKYALNSKLGKIVVVGNNMEEAYAKLNDNEKARVDCFKNKEALYENLNNVLKSNSIIGVKASRGMKFETITEKIVELSKAL